MAKGKQKKKDFKLVAQWRAARWLGPIGTLESGALPQVSVSQLEEGARQDLKRRWKKRKKNLLPDAPFRRPPLI